MVVDGTDNLSSLKIELARNADWKVQAYAAVVAALIRDNVVPKRGLAISLKSRLAVEIAHSFAGDEWAGYGAHQRAMLADKYEAIAKRIAEKSVAVYIQAPQRGLDFRAVVSGSLTEGQACVRDWLTRLGVTSQNTLFEVFGFTPPYRKKPAAPEDKDSARVSGDVRLMATIRGDLYEKLLERAARENATVDVLVEQWIDSFSN
ncbi:hypothetical protein [Caballeronia sp. GACF5]|uniref:hypothetical protein n=1 Tax=Caballeronia sp. GACF5 TaxID=2921746 RepID=UPI00202812D7|nr:hypothetical protein [Caballeronia sp. GACF5]